MRVLLWERFVCLLDSTNPNLNGLSHQSKQTVLTGQTHQEFILTKANTLRSCVRKHFFGCYTTDGKVTDKTKGCLLTSWRAAAWLCSHASCNPSGSDSARNKWNHVKLVLPRLTAHSKWHREGKDKDYLDRYNMLSLNTDWWTALATRTTAWHWQLTVHLRLIHMPCGLHSN